MAWWQISAVMNAVIAVCYVMISWSIFRGLRLTGQLRSNRLGAATAAIFLSCAFHHGSHTVLMVLPYFGTSTGMSMRMGFGPAIGVIDIAGAVIAVYYLSLRASYGRLLNSPEMFEDQLRRRTEDVLRDQAFTDLLTGLPNRAAFEERLQALQAPDIGSVAVLFVDLDKFKQVNDTLGHTEGDRLLREAGALMRASLRSGDLLFRLGGDEFTVLCALGTDEKAAVGLAERLRGVVATVPCEQVRVTASIGVGIATRSQAEALVRLADTAMYRAKRAGGDAVCSLSAQTV